MLCMRVKISIHLFYLSTYSSRQKDLDYTLCTDDYTMNHMGSTDVLRSSFIFLNRSSFFNSSFLNSRLKQRYVVLTNREFER